LRPSLQRVFDGANLNPSRIRAEVTLLYPETVSLDLNLAAIVTVLFCLEYELEQRAKQRLQLILPIVFFVIFILLYLIFHSVAEALVLIFPTIYAMSGGLLLQWLLHYNFSVAVAIGYIALFGIAVETGVVMVVYVEAAAIEGAVQRLRPKLMTVCAVLASPVPILWESGIGSDVMKPIAAPIVGGMITSTIHVLILVPVLFCHDERTGIETWNTRSAGQGRHPNQ
jgi:copper/silver efflux system protein